MRFSYLSPHFILSHSFLFDRLQRPCVFTRTDAARVFTVCLPNCTQWPLSRISLLISRAHLGGSGNVFTGSEHSSGPLNSCQCVWPGRPEPGTAVHSSIESMIKITSGEIANRYEQMCITLGVSTCICLLLITFFLLFVQFVFPLPKHRLLLCFKRPNRGSQNVNGHVWGRDHYLERARVWTL